MKKTNIIAVVGGVSMVLAACGALQQNEMAEAETDETVSASKDNVEEAAGETTMAWIPEETKESVQMAEGLYEALLNQEYAGREGYAYCIDDADYDGKDELLIRNMQIREERSGYSVQFINGGLRFDYQKTFPQEIIDANLWTYTTELTAEQDEEMVHSGIYVYSAQEHKQYWYQNEEDFIVSMGFDSAEPFYEYTDLEGQKRLTFYYDEQTQKGCGIRCYERDPTTFIATGMYGFMFEGVQEGTPRNTNLGRDFFKTESIYEGYSVWDCADNVEENVEYDEAGRIRHYDAFGILSYMADDTEPQCLLEINYEYYDNGVLKCRYYQHNSAAFATWGTTWDSYFDEMGRLVYEDTYITHGSWDTYYIYTDDTAQPAFILNLDNNAGEWIPEFWVTVQPCRP
ncbi:MAG: hypothetical protein J6C19_02265 [Lachnospiraceae bacterium]|nr:hypothetical protein [Lachnospiraceae bacterium]